MDIYLIYAAASFTSVNLLAVVVTALRPNTVSKFIVRILAALNLSALFWLGYYGWSLSTMAVAFMIAFLSLNLLRYGSARTDYKVMRRSIWLNMLMLLVGLGLLYFLELGIVNELNVALLLDVVIAMSSVAALVAAVNILKTISKSRVYKTPHLAEGEKPTVTVAIAARDEDHALEQCIDAVLSSDYTKMEVLVLDDCSSDGTGKLVRLYAQEGVRFISGQEPPLGWLGQNWANERLLKEASGDYIVFLGADVRISPQTISRMVQFARYHTYGMVSVQPMMLHLDFWPQLLQPLRLLWRAAFRNLTKKPPTYSGLWMIEKSKLENLGGFKRRSALISPEAELATLMQKKDDYFYAFANADDGVIVRKRISSLWDSAIRSYYPNLHKNPALTCYSVLIMLVVLVIPAQNLVYAILTGQVSLGATLGLISVLIWWVAHMMIVTRVSPSAWFLGAINLPIMLVVEIYLNLSSFYKYEFGKVIWKSRNVCWVEKEEDIKSRAMLKMRSNLEIKKQAK